ncbi:aldo/keto reductase [Loigolactobacillus bifermentans]|jgi:diketogulonate reductase-like aldo/keto reductase|uniref:2,5-diketo-D-gluconate reductase n=1 Tax=Loigolactobacillus bifermentans DSM 20003 TaxID=1423726 RepID=A0A0R1GX10_9LACO|nr:aldo/keto reductase [Loigolactobacillus bifermentans]KRK35207.1 2,5-diketo-D-gluconate reductase [Loigolactobacillus bifermentans DSM 20003]QGG59877.1 aldo/keto reductase [Loigolactobacillus bifermentans]
MKTTHILSDGLQLPLIGFGTSGFRGAKAVQSISSALSAGYRLIDTAYNYENEGTVGAAIRQSSVPRDQILVSSKLPGRYHRYDLAINAIQESLYRTGLEYFDLYLIHWPNPQRNEYVEAWQALIDAKKFGLVREIGVSNFLPEHLDRLQADTGEFPAVNQVELHPTFSQVDQLDYDKRHGILTEAWSPLGGHGHNLLTLAPVLQLAEKYHKSPAQVILRWEVQLGVLPLPLSQNPTRQAENLDVFDFTLTANEVEAIVALDCSGGRVTDQDPKTHEEL